MRVHCSGVLLRRCFGLPLRNILCSLAGVPLLRGSCRLLGPFGNIKELSLR